MVTGSLTPLDSHLWQSSRSSAKNKKAWGEKKESKEDIAVLTLITNTLLKWLLGHENQEVKPFLRPFSTLKTPAADYSQVFNIGTQRQFIRAFWNMLLFLVCVRCKSLPADRKGNNFPAGFYPSIFLLNLFGFVFNEVVTYPRNLAPSWEIIPSTLPKCTNFFCLGRMPLMCKNALEKCFDICLNNQEPKPTIWNAHFSNSD